MTNTEIQHLIEEKHQILYNWLNNHDPEKWGKGPEGKWTTGQQILHLEQSMKPLVKAISVPKLFLRYKFGSPNRNVRTYDEVAKRYKERLKKAEGIVSPFSSNMAVPAIEEKEDLIRSLDHYKNKLIQKMQKKWSEKTLDKYLLPHPLMGRMLVREILMWTAHHTEHHYNHLVERY